MDEAWLPRPLVVTLFWAVLASLAGATVLAVLAVDDPAWLPGAEAVVLAGGFLVAAAMRLAHWRATDEAVTLRRALGYAAAAVLVPVVTLSSPWSMAQDDRAVASVGQALVLLLVFPLLGASPRDTADRANRFATASRAGLLVVVVVVACGQTGPAGQVMAGSLLAGGWLVVADRTGDDTWFGVSMALLAIGQTVRLAGYVMGERLTGFTIGVHVAAAVLVVTATFLELDDHRRRQQADTRAAARELGEARSTLARTVKNQQRRLHDARSAVAGALGATEILAQSRDAALPELVIAELRRLAAVLDDDRVEPVTEFALDEALHSVVLAHSVACPALEADVAPIRAVGRPLATATALDNLLRNARVHAPGARLQVSTDVDAGGVHITVDDDGQGLPTSDRSSLLEFGARGNRARPGSGIGLHSVVTSMRAQAGDLTLGDSPAGGARLVLTLPGARAVASGSTSGSRS